MSSRNLISSWNFVLFCPAVTLSFRQTCITSKTTQLLHEELNRSAAPLVCIWTALNESEELMNITTIANQHWIILVRFFFVFVFVFVNCRRWNVMWAESWNICRFFFFLVRKFILYNQKKLNKGKITHISTTLKFILISLLFSSGFYS